VIIAILAVLSVGAFFGVLLITNLDIVGQISLKQGPFQGVPASMS